MDEPRKSEIELREQLSKILMKYSKRVPKRRIIQFLQEYIDGYKNEGVRAA